MKHRKDKNWKNRKEHKKYVIQCKDKNTYNINLGKKEWSRSNGVWRHNSRNGFKLSFKNHSEHSKMINGPQVESIQKKLYLLKLKTKGEILLTSARKKRHFT